jgi:hypothetical protein
MIADSYFSSPGLSNSMMSDLAVSPYRMWFLHVNPDRKPKEATPAMIFGSALHMAVLEPELFPARYCCEIDASDYPGCLVTMDDLRGWLKDKGVTPKGTRKADVIAQVQAQGDVPILDVLQSRHAAENAGKIELSKDFWYRVGNASIALRREPEIAKILSDGQAEVVLTATDPETGVLLKGKLDWVNPGITADIKSFSQTKRRSIDKTITDALYYEGYLHQAVFYSMLRGWPEWKGDFIFAFIESEPPHEVRLRSVRSRSGGEPSLYWQRSLLHIRSMIRLYADCVERFGDKPWRTDCKVDPLWDEDIPQLAW